MRVYDIDDITINADILDGGSTDNCVDGENLIFSVNQSVFNCSDTGTNMTPATVVDQKTAAALDDLDKEFDSI